MILASGLDPIPAVQGFIGFVKAGRWLSPERIPDPTEPTVSIPPPRPTPTPRPIVRMPTVPERASTFAESSTSSVKTGFPSGKKKKNTVTGDPVKSTVGGTEEKKALGDAGLVSTVSHAAGDSLRPNAYHLLSLSREEVRNVANIHLGVRRKP